MRVIGPGDAILALDLGASGGWAIREPDGKIRSGTWQAPPGQPFGARMAWFTRWLNEALDQLLPAAVIAEAPIPIKPGEVKTNYNTQRSLNGMFGIAAGIPGDAGMVTDEIAIATAKKAVTGNGRASKDEMKTAISRLGHKFKNDNQADAIAVLIAFCARHQIPIIHPGWGDVAA